MQPYRRFLFAVSLPLLSGAALAQAPTTTSKAPSPGRSAVSKTCSDQANAQGLHGKARKHFRRSCMRGKA